MINLLSLLDVAPSPLDGGLGSIIAAMFFLILAAVAVFTFIMIRKTVKMAIRLIIVGLILLVALVGSVALWFTMSGSSGGKSVPPRPSANKPAR